MSGSQPKPFGLDDLPAEIARINQSHLRSLRAEAKYNAIVAERHRALLESDPSLVDRLVALCPTMMFVLSERPCAVEHLWADKDDVIDQLVVARNLAKSSPQCAEFLMGSPKAMLALLSGCGMREIRNTASRVYVGLRWSSRELETMLCLVRERERETKDKFGARVSDAILLMMSISTKQLSRPFAARNSQAALSQFEVRAVAGSAI